MRTRRPVLQHRQNAIQTQAHLQRSTLPCDPSNACVKLVVKHALHHDLCMGHAVRWFLRARGAARHRRHSIDSPWQPGDVLASLPAAFAASRASSHGALPGCAGARGRAPAARRHDASASANGLQAPVLQNDRCHKCHHARRNGITGRTVKKGGAHPRR
jgi:hypothetical protein